MTSEASREKDFCSFPEVMTSTLFLFSIMEMGKSNGSKPPNSNKNYGLNF